MGVGGKTTGQPMATQDFKEPTFFRNRVKFIILPDVNGDIIPAGITVPIIKGRNVLAFQNTAPLSITNFTGGALYQTIKLIGDGFTTLKHNATIKNNTGADKLLAVNKAYNYTLINNIWIEDAD